MNSFTIALLIAAAALVVLAGRIAFSSWGKTAGGGRDMVNINVREDAHVTISHTEKGGRIEIVYDTYEERRQGGELIPDLVNDTPAPDGAADLQFWLDVSSRRSLPVERQQEIAERLVREGYLTEEGKVSFLAPPQEDDTAGTEPGREHETVDAESFLNFKA